jgi:glycosyltransferase involved in cell wall biosynthesis
MTPIKNSEFKVGIIIPVFMEEEIIRKFHQSLLETIDGLPYQFSIIYIDDGSTDGTAKILKELAVGEKRITVVELTRNFGHQSALTAGLEIAPGDVVITLDGDGQHPVSMIPEMVNLFSSGYDIVQTQREDGKSRSLKNYSAHFFYWIIGIISNTRIKPGTADFRLLSRPAVDALKLLPEYHRFLRGLIPWMGFPTVTINYKPLDRIGGSSKYSIKKMMSLAADAIFSFSTTPIKISLGLGAVFLLLAFCETLYALSFLLTNRIDLLVPGWPSLMFILLLGNALILINIGIIGMYIGYVFQQVKGRPNYIVKSIINKESIE